MDIGAILMAFFESVAGVSQMVEKGLPTPKIQEEKFEIKKPALEAKEKQKILRQSKAYLTFNPRQKVATYINFKYGQALSTEDVAELILALDELFPRRAK